MINRRSRAGHRSTLARGAALRAAAIVLALGVAACGTQPAEEVNEDFDSSAGVLSADDTPTTDATPAPAEAPTTLAAPAPASAPRPSAATRGAAPTATAAPGDTAAPTTARPSTAPQNQAVAKGEVAQCNFDPNRRVDLSGIAGVTCEQQAWAESFATRTIDGIAKKYADYRAAEADGYRTTDDAFTGFEHFVNWKWIGEGDDFNPARPESLVYVPGKDGSKTLVAAMFMLPYTGPIENEFKPGGNLMQYHAHDNLCYRRNPDGSWQLVGATNEKGECPPDSVKPGDPSPMVHVWVIPHRIYKECGPFASIEGPAGGRVPPGEERLCIPQHGDSVKWS